MRVVPKVQPREAWQYVPLNGGPWPKWVENCTMIRVIDGEGCLLLQRNSGNQRIAPFDWIIQDLDGEPEWLSDEEMKKTYEQVVG